MRVVIYARISKDRAGAGLGVERQTEDCKALAKTLGWTVVAVFTDNDLSAYSGKPRPGYQAMMEALQSDEAKAVLAWHTDRLHRSPAELEEFITVCEDHSVVVRTVQSGEIDLSTPAGQMTARIVGAVARHEIDHARKRMKSAHAQAAERGSAHGRIPFGYRAVRDDAGRVIERVPDESEARLVREAVDQVLAGRSLFALVREWNGRGLVTRGGGRWTASNLGQMIVRPTYAGFRSHRGVTTKGGWEPIVTGGEHERLVAILSDPKRRTGHDNQVKYLLSGIALCGECGSVMYRLKNHGYPSYVCHARRCTSRAVRFVDELVSEAVIDRLSQPDFMEALEKPREDTAAEDAELKVLRARLSNAVDMFADGGLDRDELQQIRQRITPRIAELERAVKPVFVSPVFDEFQDQDARKVWLGMPVAKRRGVVDALLLGVVVQRSRGRKDFSAVRLVWREFRD